MFFGVKGDAAQCNRAAAGDDYGYELNGNMVKDLNKDIVHIGYNHLNLPTQVNKHELGGGNWMHFEYGALGAKMKKVVSDNYNISETEYAGNYIYEDGQLRMFFQPEGYVEPVDPGDYSQGFVYVYQYSDIWGNVRLSYKNIGTASSPDLQIQDEKNYYPFGMEHQGYNGNLIGNENHYQTYQNKELEEGLGLDWHDFGARRFQSDIARWTTLDPLAEKFYSWSPYTGMNNNPVMFVDPTGMASESTDIEFETSDVDVMVNVGYGRKMASSQFGGAMSFSGGTPVLNGSGQEKFQGAFDVSERQGFGEGQNPPIYDELPSIYDFKNKEEIALKNGDAYILYDNQWLQIESEKQYNERIKERKQRSRKPRRPPMPRGAGEIRSYTHMMVMKGGLKTHYMEQEEKVL